ncbi:hypothetical protein CLAFUW4_12035 [Fulvia fulva]|uniref:Uncharacterized protein n=1 Tax=Passalora fulva TaxID=5499 RepID=A0A9Q8PF68_PASFU|nr:uncharacterized protein CLAFUR5_11074 [Fulvia fulva]KAK4617794.1 hypothetical protein CLAFUR4_12040 [Fulvia fulva]KAK4618834.1 hypothetical protein CLAFUR0_12051 [Fulvia fulva]UJO21358.1 hypothetical protein CLAFUR5_11074 [Fulvia fulva]WPV18049.1 hypothetical protein CLAFUW4_12035 [Fulvia fulva]WPV32915.1 hypothetical protein CLAFUW7_12042 [Fulvia fulva]
MGFTNILLSVLAATSIFIATTSAAPFDKEYVPVVKSAIDPDSDINFAAIPCNKSNDPTATACMRFEIEWKYDVDFCAALVERAIRLLHYQRFGPFTFTCDGDDDGNTLVELKPIDEAHPHCDKRARDDPPMVGGAGMECLHGRPDDYYVVHEDDSGAIQALLADNNQKRELEAQAPLAQTDDLRDHPEVLDDIEPNTQSCKSWPLNAAYSSYVIQIGTNWNPGICDPLFEKINAHRDQGVDAEWKCQSDWTGHILISFNTAGSDAEARALNSDLSWFFPSINGFNCEVSVHQQPVDQGGPPVGKHEMHRRDVPEDAVDPNTQSCRSWKIDAAFSWYLINIGANWNPAICDPLFKRLNVHRDQGTDANWSCQPDWSGGILISFNTSNSDAEAQAINSDLSYVFPSIDGGFNCGASTFRWPPDSGVLHFGEQEKQLQKRRFGGPRHPIPVNDVLQRAVAKKDQISDETPKQVEKRQTYYPDGPLEPQTQACHTVNHGFYNWYLISIGWPIDEDRCRDAGAAMDAAWIGFNEYRCFEDIYGNTRITFEMTINKGGNINNFLHEYWPEVNGFNCPDN